MAAKSSYCNRSQRPTPTFRDRHSDKRAWNVAKTANIRAATNVSEAMVHTLFGQIPDTLKDVWVQLAEHDEAKARELIDRTTATKNPFDIKYSKVEDAQWESCTTVLNSYSKGELLRKSW